MKVKSEGTWMMSPEQKIDTSPPESRRDRAFEITVYSSTYGRRNTKSLTQSVTEFYTVTQ